MLNFWQNAVIVTAAMACALAFWWIIRRAWPPERRRLHNEITGWQISVLGTTYAVIIGFMLFAVWSDFKAAQENVETEASCLVDLYWSTSGLPQAQRQEIRKLALDYADAMITDEWPAMARRDVSNTGTLIVQQLWEAASENVAFTPPEQVSLEQTMSEIGNITVHRRIRQLQSEINLHPVLWIVLIVGGGITIMSSCLFGSEYPALHMLQVVTLALLLSLSLVAIADISHPFRGMVHVKPTGFENAKTRDGEIPEHPGRSLRRIFIKPWTCERLDRA
jgi:hypothetical protein